MKNQIGLSAHKHKKRNKLEDKVIEMLQNELQRGKLRGKTD